MCGICGVIAPGEPDRGALERMTRALAHRGPDDVGIWYGDGVGLGHRRLSIIDLSGGCQPMANADGRYRIVYNGEVSNFRALRAELEKDGRRFATRSDTEVVLAAYERFGPACVERLCGMFAFAVYDARERALFLARDHVGIKPLVYWHDGRTLVFASELAALLKHPRVPRDLDPAALSDYVSFQCVPGPGTIFAGVRKLPPAHTAVFKDGALTLRRYWRADYNRKRRGAGAALADEVWSTFKEVVADHLVSDVPLGVFLSGGIDSTLVTAAACELQGRGRVQTFAVGFADRRFGELPFSREAAARFGTEHHELIVEPKLVEALPTLVRHYGEPFADPSAIPTYYIAQETRQCVTVALAGDGGDELFAGYRVFGQMLLAARANPLLRLLHPALRRLNRMVPERASKRRLPRWLRFLALTSGPLRSAYPSLRCDYYLALKDQLFTPAFKAAVDPAAAKARYQQEFDAGEAKQFIDQLLDIDTRFTLPYDLLAKVDIATMAHSLEVRVPFLDRRMVDLAASLPVGLKQRGPVGKYVLKKILERWFPREFIHRRKQGFSLPLAHWMRHDLKNFVHDLLWSDAMRRSEWFRHDTVSRLYEDHQAGREDNSGTLWLLMNFALWQREFLGERN